MVTLLRANMAASVRTVRTDAVHQLLLSDYHLPEACWETRRSLEVQKRPDRVRATRLVVGGAGSVVRGGQNQQEGLQECVRCSGSRVGSDGPERTSKNLTESKE
ncbi:hypothetical protein FQA47_003480 [Oryzias melastigma]|uniref:Uncharacterized protein n=1 Tax=Oryzias melastigma TaxID=30732 RepID=A0A834C763_ORYME|nr:hypothetical protein FQA47_003480 [Oryzias melastigma]